MAGPRCPPPRPQRGPAGWRRGPGAQPPPSSPPPPALAAAWFSPLGAHLRASAPSSPRGRRGAPSSRGGGAGRGGGGDGGLPPRFVVAAATGPHPPLFQPPPPAGPSGKGVSWVLPPHTHHVPLPRVPLHPQKYTLPG